MKKALYALALCLLPMAMAAQTFTSMWKKVSEAQEKDLPQTQQKWLAKIIDKAESSKEYGHLIKAQLLSAAVQTQIAPDSLDAELARLEQQEQQAKDPAVRAVYQSVLGKVYETRGDDEQNDKARSKEWFAKSMQDPQMLAQHKSAEYEPALTEGIDSKIFYDDLLHVLGIEAQDYKTLYDYYAKTGNRPAACICAFLLLQQDRREDLPLVRKSKYLQTVDSLLNVYGDLREAGELAIEHYRFMSQATDATVEERVNYINYALAHWGAWPRMNILRNALSDLQQPSFNINIGDYMMLPGVERKMHVNSIRNINQLNVNIYRVNVEGNTHLDPSEKSDYAKLQKLIFPGAVQTVTKRYIGQPAWKENSDSLIIEGLPVGVYLMEATTDNGNIQPQRALLRVSNLYVMYQGLPDKRMQFVVVNATTGKPVQGAKVVLSEGYYGDDDFKPAATLVSDKNGEALYGYTNRPPSYVYAYTNEDKACGNFDIRTGFYFWNNDRNQREIALFTDRSIYRPGQQVSVAALLYDVDSKALKANVADNRSVTLTLRDANRKEVARQVVTTDAFGKASADFTLPQNGLTGRFVIEATSDGARANTSVSVEQYKRPTFQVEFDKYREKYQAGDTVQVRGVAKSFAGVPVQGAKVEYEVTRRRSIWWRWGYSDERPEVYSGTATTGYDGSFTAKVPMIYPDRADLEHPVYYTMSVEAKVTDVSGETREGSISLPLSNRATVLTSDLPGQQQRDSLKTITFIRKNVAGESIEGSVQYRFDGEAWKTAKANTPVLLDKKLAPGRHLMEAICESDTLKQSVIIFTMNDKKPVIKTRDWYYCSASQFPNDGHPVYLQVGSSDEHTTIYYTVFSGDKVIEQGHREISNEVVTRKLQYKPEFGEGITITTAWVRNGRLYHHVTNILRPMPDTRLKLTWKTFRDKLTPGQKEEWTLQILSPKGAPAQAQLLAGMYDKSLEAIQKHQWDFSLDMKTFLHAPFAHWEGGSNEAIGLYGFQNYRALNERQLSFSHFDEEMFQFSMPAIFYTRSNRPIFIRGSKLMKSEVGAMAAVMSAEAAQNGDQKAFDMAESPRAQSVNPADNQDMETSKAGQAIQVRENLNETAFFYPALTTDKAGNVSIKFTLPESVTTWQFMGLAHDKDMNCGEIGAEAVAQKTVMVQPNLPRFIRTGDKAQAGMRIFNTSERRVSGTARLQILNPETDAIVCEWSKPFSVEPNGTAIASFDMNGQQLSTLSKGGNLFAARVLAEGKDFSDGEQHYLPLLSDEELITATLPFTQNGPGVKDISIGKLFPANSKDNKLTIEYTGNPAWLIVQALPTIATPNEKNAVSLATAIYANSIGHTLLSSAPEIGRVIKLWQQETGGKTSLTSSLQKNEELKTMILSETPWVAEAESETAQRQQLINFLDESTIDYRLGNYIQQLKALQNTDGSFSWWPDMPGNVYMTMAVTKILTRLDAMVGKQPDTSELLARAFSFLDRKIAEEVTELKKQEKTKQKQPAPSELACDYLYANALAKRRQTDNISYLVGLLEKMPTSLTIYGKAGSAVILSQYGKVQRAKEYLQSISEYTVYKEEMGRYFDTKRAQYSWFDYKIPTQVAAIEAMKSLKADDTKTIEEMQRWLLQEKRTTGWSTALNAADAVYAFLADKDGKADMAKLTSGQDAATLKLDGRTVDLPKATAGLGYVKTTIQPVQASTFTAEKTSSGTSWGALYAQFLQKSTDVQDASAGLTVKRELLDGNATGSTNGLKVGDKVRVRITVTADRDYDFVQVQDKRAACLEPAAQLSGYRGGYYCAPQDNATNYYFDRLAKGKHVIETEYYVDREGDYASGICTAQCAYSPEYSGREAAKQVKVTK